MTAVLVTLAVFAAGIGLAMAPPASLGLGLLAVALLCACFARIAQAADHQHLLDRWRREVMADQGRRASRDAGAAGHRPWEV
ncbi:MAG: hypothetical protein R2712_23105 [Vicinamibacterales bacterium]